MYAGKFIKNDQSYQINLYYPNGSLIKTLQTFQPSESESFGFNSLSILRIPNHESKYLVFLSGGLYSQRSGNESSTSTFTVTKTANGYSVQDHKETLLKNASYSVFTQHRNGIDLWYITQRYDSLLAYQISSSGISSNPIKSKIPRFESYKELSTGMRFSRDGTAIAVRSSNKQKDSIEFGSAYLTTLNFDPLTGAFYIRSHKFEIPFLLTFKTGDRSFGRMTNFSFWKDSKDSLIFTYTYRKPQNQNIVLFDCTNRTLTPYNLAIKNHPNIPFYWCKNIQYSNTGNQYIFGIYKKSNLYQESVLRLSNFKNGTIECSLQVMESDNRNTLERLPPNGNTAQIIYSSHPITFEYDQRCDSTIEFTFTGDTSFFSRYHWEFSDGTKLTGLKAVKKVKIEGQHKVKIIGVTKLNYSRYIIDTFSVKSNLFKPNARFSLKDTIGCQWINKTFINTSKVQNKGSNIFEWWDFGDDTRSTQLFGTLSSYDHTYTKSGEYQVSLIINDGYCSDTFAYPLSVKILKAPEPRIVLSDSKDCIPIDISAQYPLGDSLINVKYNWGNIYLDSATGSLSKSFKSVFKLSTISEAMKTIDVIQTLTGPTGCKTKDTTSLALYNSFDPQIKPSLELVSTIKKNQIQIEWDPIANTNTYSLFRDYTKLYDGEQTYYFDTIPTDTQIYNYTLQLNNVCGETSLTSKEYNNIVLCGSVLNFNTSFLKWNTDYIWNGSRISLSTISLPSSSEDIFSLRSDAQTYKDFNFLPSNPADLKSAEGKEYQLIIETSEGNRQALSNSISLKYKPAIFIPTSFTPNNDGLNDSFGIRGVGIKNYRMEIYNSYGQKIFDKINGGWDGSSYDGEEPVSGLYLYVIEYLIYENIRITKTGTIIVLK